MKSTDDPVVRMAKLLAKYHYHMAKEITEAIGFEQGSQVVLRAIQKFAEDRVRGMRAEAAERGLPLDSMDTYRQVRDMPGNAQERNPDNRSQITYCGMNEAWSEYGEEGKKLGYLYCSIDYTLYKGWGAELDRPTCLALGDECCDFRVKPK